MFQDSVKRGVTVKVVIPAETSVSFIGEYSATMNATGDSMACTELNMETNTGAEHTNIAMLVPHMDAAHTTENIIMNVVRVHEEGDSEKIKEVILKGITTRAMGGAAAVYIPTYLSTGEVTNTVLALRA